jgi:hypothetical protein
MIKRRKNSAEVVGTVVETNLVFSKSLTSKDGTQQGGFKKKAFGNPSLVIKTDEGQFVKVELNKGFDIFPLNFGKENYLYEELQRLANITLEPNKDEYPVDLKGTKARFFGSIADKSYAGTRRGKDEVEWISGTAFSVRGMSTSNLESRVPLGNAELDGYIKRIVENPDTGDLRLTINYVGGREGEEKVFSTYATVKSDNADAFRQMFSEGVNARFYLKFMSEEKEREIDTSYVEELPTTVGFMGAVTPQTPTENVKKSYTVYDTVVLNAVPDETAERLTVDEMKTLENEQSIRIEAEIQKKKQASSATVNNTFATAFTTQTTGSFMQMGNDAFSAEEKMELPF